MMSDPTEALSRAAEIFRQVKRMASEHPTEAFFRAAKSGDVETVRALLKIADVGADANKKSCALRSASKCGHTKVVEVLLQAGVDIHIGNDAALRFAADENHVQIVEILLRAGAIVNALDYDALHCASKKGNTEIVKLLLLKKVPDTHVLNKALVSATRGCHAQTVKLLLQSGADADSALLWAGTEILNILLQEGANIYANNDSALRWASDFHCHDIVNILVMHYIELKRRLDKSIDDAFDILASHNDSYVGMIALLVVEDPRLIDRIKSKKTKDAVCIELLRIENVAVTFVAEQIQSRKTPLVRYLLHVMATMVYIPINV